MAIKIVIWYGLQVVQAVLILIAFYLILKIILIIIGLSKRKRVPWVPSMSYVLKFIVKHGLIKNGDNFIDLGSGTGTVVLKIAKYLAQKGADFTQIRLSGVEISRCLTIIANFSKKFLPKQARKSVVFINSDINDIALSQYNKVYMFLMPQFMRKIMPKLGQELKEGTIVFSNMFKLPQNPYFMLVKRYTVRKKGDFLTFNNEYLYVYQKIGKT